MTGSLQIKKNTYYAVINVFDDKGNKKQKWISTKIKVEGNNKREAQKAFRDILKEYEDSHIAYSKEIYFSDWLEDWLEKMKYNVELSSWEGYKINVKAHLIPYFKPKKITLSNITPKNVQDYYTSKLKDGRCDGKGGLSANTIKRHSVIIKSSLDEAMKMNLIAYNPADRATLPKVEKFVGKHFSVEEAEKLLNVIKGEALEPLIMLTLFYGLRRSEILGLKWDAIDFENNTIIIRNTIVRMTTLVEKQRTKNKSSLRTLPLMADIKKYLKQLKKKQLEYRLMQGNSFTKNDYVCIWDDGKPFKPDYVSRKFKSILENNNLPSIRFHDLRHTCASLLLSKNFSLKEIQEWLGHNDISTTANIYGHLEFKSKISMADKMGETLRISNVN